MAVHNDNGSVIENAEFGPSFKGLSVLDEEDDDYLPRSSFGDEFNNSQKSPIKGQPKDGHIYAMPQLGVRNNLTAAFTSMEGNHYMRPPPSNNNPGGNQGLLNILSHALKPDGHQKTEPNPRGLALIG